MKFWQANQNNKINTKLIFDTPPGASHGPGDSIEYSSFEREESLRNSHSELDSLRGSLEVGQEKLSMPINDQVEVLRRLARRESIQDIVSESDQTWLQSVKDTVGRGYEISKVYSRGELEEKEAYHEGRIEHKFLKIVSNEAVLRFIQDYRLEAQSLFTDQTGDGEFRAEFYANQLVGRNVNFMDLYSTSEAPYIKMGNVTYARTPNGYKSFYDGRALSMVRSFDIGDIASVQSGTTYTVLNDLTDDEAEALDSVKNGENKHPAFAVLNESNAKIQQLEDNRERNFYTAQNWKLFAGRMVDTYSKEPFTNFETQDSVTEVRDIFASLKGYFDATNENLDSIPGITLTALNKTEKPQEFLNKINTAISQVYDQQHARLNEARSQFRQDLENPDSESSSEGLMLSQVKEKETGAIINSLDGNLETFVIEQTENNKQAVEQVDSDIESKLLEHFSEEEITRLQLREKISELLTDRSKFDENLANILVPIRAHKGEKAADEFYNLLNNKYRVTLRSTSFEEVASHQKFLQVKQQLLAKLGGNFLLQEAFEVAGISTPSDLTSQKLEEVRQLLERKITQATPEEAERIKASLPELTLLANGLAAAEVTRRIEEEDIAQRVNRLEEIGTRFREITRERELIRSGEITPEEAKETFWGKVEEKTEVFKKQHKISDKAEKPSSELQVAQITDSLNLPSGVNVEGVDPENPNLFVVNLGESGASEYRLDPARGLIHQSGLDTPFADALYISADNPAGAMAMGGLIKSQYLTGTDGLAFQTKAFGNLEMNELFSVIFEKRAGEPLPAIEAQSWETLGAAMQKSKTSFGEIIDALSGGSTTNEITQERSITAQDMGSIQSGLDDLLLKARTMTPDQLATHLSALSNKLLP